VEYQMKRYVVRVHYSRRGGAPWTVHYRGKCLKAEAVDFQCWTKTEFKPDSRSNPKAFIRAYGEVVDAGEGRLVVRS
jgi:hypothetical protein